MKIFCLILSVFVLMQSAFPECLEADEPAGLSLNIDAEHEESEEHEDDCKDCSPFLSCGTCAGFVFMPFEYVFQKLDIAPIVKLVSIPHLYSGLYLQSIWQPPKFD